mgnify:CR=1 FL=1
MDMDAASVADHPRPWVTNYPEGINWQVELNLKPGPRGRPH